MKDTWLVLGLCILLISCSESRKADRAQTNAPVETPKQETSTTPASGPRVTVHLKSGRKLAGIIIASAQSDVTVEAEDGTEIKIPLVQVASIDYSDARPKESSAHPPQPKPVKPAPAQVAEVFPRPTADKSAAPPPPGWGDPARESQPAAAAAEPISHTLELPAGSEISVRLNETIDSKTAQSGQTFDAEVTRNIRNVAGTIVIPRAARARVMIKSAMKGDHFHGASDLIIDMKSVTINGKRYAVDTAYLRQKGRDGVGFNSRTAKFAGAGAAIGALVGAIAGGGKGAAIGAGAGAGAGAIGQLVTKGYAIRIPAETVLTFHLEQPLVVTVSD